MVAVGDGPCWWDYKEGIVLPQRPQVRGQEMTHICPQSCWRQSKAFSDGLSILWTGAISEMFLIPQLYWDQPKLQPLELWLLDGRWKVNTLSAACQSCCMIKRQNKTHFTRPFIWQSAQPQAWKEIQHVGLEGRER